MSINIWKASEIEVGIKLSNNLISEASDIAEFVIDSKCRFKGIDFEYPSMTAMPPCEAIIKYNVENGLGPFQSLRLVPNAYLVKTADGLQSFDKHDDLIGYGLVEVEGIIYEAEDVIFIDLRDKYIKSEVDMFKEIFKWCGDENLSLESFNLHGTNSYSITVDGVESGQFSCNDILVVKEQSSSKNVIHIYNEEFLVGDGYTVQQE